MAGQPGFFDLADRYEALSAAGDPLERLASVVDFEVFNFVTAPIRHQIPSAKGDNANVLN